MGRKEACAKRAAGIVRGRNMPLNRTDNRAAITASMAVVVRADFTIVTVLAALISPASDLARDGSIRTFRGLATKNHNGKVRLLEVRLGGELPADVFRASWHEVDAVRCQLRAHSFERPETQTSQFCGRCPLTRETRLSAKSLVKRYWFLIVSADEFIPHNLAG